MGHRETQIYRDWRKANLQPSRVLLWQAWTLPRTLGLLVVAICFLLPDLEYPFWGSDDWHWFLRFFLGWHHPTGWGGVIVLVYPINILLVESYLRLRTPDGTRVRVGVLALRAVIAGIPLFGLSAIPIWRWLLDNRPGWVYRRLARRDRALDERGRPSRWSWTLGRWLQKTQSSLLFVFWLWSVNFVVLHLAVSDLGASDWMTTPRRLGIVIALHLLGLGCTAFHLLTVRKRYGWSRWKTLGMWLAVLAWTLPQPLCFVALFVFAASVGADHRTPSLLDRANRSTPATEALRRQVERYWTRQPVWSRWRGPWGLEHEQKMTEADLRLASFYRTKTFLLIFDVMAVTQLAVWLAPIHPAGVLFFLVLAAASLVSMLVIVACFALVAVHRLSHTVRFGLLNDAADQNPVLGYLVLTQAALVAGFGLGGALAFEHVFLLTMGMGMLGLTYLTFDLSAGGGSKIGWGRWPSASVRFFWAGLYFLPLGLAFQMIHFPWLPELVFGFLRWSSRHVVFWALLLVVHRSSVLLFPHDWRNLHRAVASRRSPRWMTAMLLTAAIPLGGLAIPLWFLFRDRLAVSAAEQP